MNEPEKAAPKQAGGRFQRGRSGNPAGRPPGARNKATRAAEALLDGEAAALTRKAIQLALDGDATALRLCMERVIAPRRDRPLTFALPKIESAADAANGMSAIIVAVAAGEVSPGEATEIARLIESFTKARELGEFEARLAALEAERKQA